MFTDQVPHLIIETHAYTIILKQQLKFGNLKVQTYYEKNRLLIYITFSVYWLCTISCNFCVKLLQVSKVKYV